MLPDPRLRYQGLARRSSSTRVSLPLDVLLSVVQLSLILCLAVPAAAQSEAPDTRFVDTVWPILSANCLTCHGPFYQLSGLRLDSAERIERGGQGGPIIEPGDALASELYRRISRLENDPDRMPQKAPRLDDRDIEAIRDWIESGAGFGDFVDAEALP